MGVVHMGTQRRQHKAYDEPDRETCNEPDCIGQIRDIHDLRDDRGQAGAVKTDVNVAGHVFFVIVGIEVYAEKNCPDI